MEQPRNSPLNRDRWDIDKVRFHLDDPPAPQRDIKPLAEVIRDVVEGMDQPVQENVLILRKVWAELVGAQIAKHSEPGFIKDFQLNVFVDHPGWMPELERIKRILLRKLDDRYRQLDIRKLCFILRS